MEWLKKQDERDFAAYLAQQSLDAEIRDQQRWEEARIKEGHSGVNSQNRTGGFISFRPHLMPWFLHCAPAHQRRKPAACTPQQTSLCCALGAARTKSSLILPCARNKRTPSSARSRYKSLTDDFQILSKPIAQLAQEEI